MMHEEENIEPGFTERFKKNPFKTPENYFDTIESRVMERINHESKEQSMSRAGKVIRLLKPALGLAASFALVFVLVYFPVNYFSKKEIAKTSISDTVSTEAWDFYSLTFALTDESSLINTLMNDGKSDEPEITSDEMLAYLSSEMNDIEIYSEIQNK